MNRITMFLLPTLFLFRVDRVSSFALRLNKNNKNPSQRWARVPVEDVVAQQIALLRQEGQMQRAFDDFFCLEAQVESDYQGFVETLQTDQAFCPLVEQGRATVTMVVQDPDPARCACLVRVVSGSDSNSLHLLDYWWTLKLEERIVSSDKEILIRSRPGPQAVWKVESIEPNFESLDWESSNAAYFSNLWETDDDISLFVDRESDRTSQEGLEELWGSLGHDDEDDDDDDDQDLGFDEEDFMIPIQYYGSSTETKDDADADMSDSF